MERERNALFPFFGQMKAALCEIILPGINLFSSRQNNWPIFQCHQGNEVFEEILDTFCTLWSRKIHL